MAEMFTVMLLALSHKKDTKRWLCQEIMKHKLIGAFYNYLNYYYEDDIAKEKNLK